MTEFISNTQTPEANHDALDNDVFYPAITLVLLRTAQRVSTVNDGQAQAALQTAIYHVNTELAEWRAVQTDAINAANRHHYQTAVCTQAKAQLLEDYRDYDTTKSGHDRADALDPRVEDYRRRSHVAIAAIRGRPTLDVALI